MRFLLPFALACTGAALPASAQTRIDSSGIHAPGVSIDSRGVRTGGTTVDARGVRAGNTVVDAGGVRTGGGGRVIRINGGRRAVDCAGGALTLDGNANHFSVANCRSVTVDGNNNVLDVSFGAAGRLATMGNSNAVTWHAPRGARVAVSDLGTRNAVSRR